MDTNSNALLNRVEIFFYSTLISCLSAVNRFRSKEEHLADLSFQPTTIANRDSFIEIQEGTDDPFIKMWTKVSQAILPIIIWMILGFAAGFLIGMIRPR